MPHEADFPSDLRALEHDYELIRELGQGGMAAVYLARRRTSGELVAIKAIRARYLDDNDALQRFAREARTVADLDHPNIVRTHAIEQIDDRAIAIIMEHVAGGTVRDWLREYGSLGAEHAERVLRDVASALRYAHQRGIVHRDVKPENIFLDAQSGRALLSDFGIARQIDGDAAITLLGAALGTPQYMSPEQIDGEKVDGRSDIYSLGVLGWELLTGRRPWAGESLYGIIYKQKHEELPRITSVRPRVPANLLFAIEGALRKDKTQRWQTVDEFLHQLTYNPPPLLAQAYPPGAAPPANEPTLRFRSPTVEAATALRDSAGIGSMAPPAAVAAAPSPIALPPSYSAGDRPMIHDATAGHAHDATADHVATQHAARDHVMPLEPIAEVEYALPGFDDAGETNAGTRFGRGRLARAAALLVPLTIAGVSLMVILGGRSSLTPPRSARGNAMTSSAGTIAPEGVSSAIDSAAPRTIPAARSSGDSAGGAGAAIHASPEARDVSPSVERAESEAGQGRSDRARGAAVGTRDRASQLNAEAAASHLALGVPKEPGESTRMPGAAGPDVARDRGATRTDSNRTDRPSPDDPTTDRVPEDPFRPPESPLPSASATVAVGVADRGGRAGVTGSVPSPRCRLASSADQQACLAAYIAAGDATMEQAFDALIAELRRVAHVEPADPDPPTAHRVRIEQRAWLSVRDNECPRQPLPGSDPFWAGARSRCFTEMAASRTGELREAVRRLRRR